MPIGALLGALVSGLGVAAEASAQGAQQNLGWANLFETKRANRKKEQLATADQVDARGNRIYYTPGVGWQIELDPETKKILEAEDYETIMSLTEDATRNRDAARRMDDRSIEADDEFERAFNEYRYRPEKSEAEYIGDAQREKLLARREGSNRAAADMNRNLIRQGQGGDVGKIFAEARNQEANEFEAALLGGKRQGIQDFLSVEGAKDQQDMGELGFLSGLAGQTTNMPQRFTNRADTLSSGAESAMDELLAILAQNESSRQGATGQLMQVLGQSPNFAPLASALGQLGGSFEGSARTTEPVARTRNIPYPRPYEEGVRARLRAGF